MDFIQIKYRNIVYFRTQNLKKNIVYNLFHIDYNVNEFSCQEIIVDFPKHPSGEFFFNLNYNDS